MVYCPQRDPFRYDFKDGGGSRWWGSSSHFRRLENTHLRISGRVDYAGSQGRFQRVLTRRILIFSSHASAILIYLDDSPSFSEKIKQPSKLSVLSFKTLPKEFWNSCNKLSSFDWRGSLKNLVRWFDFFLKETDFSDKSSNKKFGPK